MKITKDMIDGLRASAKRELAWDNACDRISINPNALLAILDERDVMLKRLKALSITFEAARHGSWRGGPE